MNSMGILVASCDKNKWLLDVFFKQFFSCWTDCACQIYLALEELKYDWHGKNINTINSQKNEKWCKRVIKALEQVKEEYVLVMLDDFIIENQIDTNVLQSYVELMQLNDIYNIILTPILDEMNYVNSGHMGLEHRHRFGRYKTSLQCGLWNRSILLSLLRNGESAWEFELFGNIRSFVYKDRFHTLKETTDKPIKYNNGFFVVQGKVNLDEKYRLEKVLQYDIEIGETLTFVEKDMVRDDIRFVPRVLRRIKIMMFYLLYRIKYLVSGECI